ncbi:hypothetical protein [Azospirillum brasilense]|uniref:hypothetical protein n=1 Tax=Azospirillum brasilense TaxID=192 RepID=UPI000E69E1E9|nr:hypothetical protein [Azospirillum brasilense]NUB23560.1 hypothetical protein [Azospirillum brasilense]NUB30715.1 hypothetical protein [Azospirillum brasilense]RIW05161.1 hypothetical protein D2T81_08470 [Azospirillum brasilense]
MSVAMMPLPERSPLPFDPAMAPAERCRLLVAAFPGALREILAAGTLGHRPRFGENGFEGLQENWLPPAGVSARQVAMAQRVLADLRDSILAPAEPDHLLGRVLALLSHFPAKGLTPDVEQLVAMDWVEDLGEFPAWAIDDAARAWRRTRKWRPSIAEMRALCEESCAKERVLAQRLRQIVQTSQASNAGNRLAEIRRFP